MVEIINILRIINSHVPNPFLRRKSAIGLNSWFVDLTDFGIIVNSVTLFVVRISIENALEVILSEYFTTPVTGCQRFHGGN